MTTIRVDLADRVWLAQAQSMVTQHHYLHRPVDPRCSVLGYIIAVDEEPAGCLLFGRPEATHCYPWYGDVEDVASGRARLSRWEVINLARVWLDPDVQQGGQHHVPNLATRAIAQALRRVVVDYLMHFHVCFPDEPWQLREVLSYCDTTLHHGTLYRASNFKLVRTNPRGLQTWARPLRHLTHAEQRAILKQSEFSIRSRRYRAQREATERSSQLMLL